MRISQDLSWSRDFLAQEAQEVYAHKKRSLTMEIKSKIAFQPGDLILIDSIKKQSILI